MARIAIVGGGWAGLAAAVEATRAGHEVTLFEAARTLGGRARSLDISGPGDPNAVSYFLLVEAAVETGKELIAKFGWGAGTVLFNSVLSGAQTGYVEYLKANGIAMSADFHTNAPPSVN